MPVTQQQRGKSTAPAGQSIDDQIRLQMAQQLTEMVKERAADPESYRAPTQAQIAAARARKLESIAARGGARATITPDARAQLDAERRAQAVGMPPLPSTETIKAFSPAAYAWMASHGPLSGAAAQRLLVQIHRMLELAAAQQIATHEHRELQRGDAYQRATRRKLLKLRLKGG